MLIKPKKSLGQNFLIDKNVINLIVNSGKITEKDTLLEIGPGTGNLTRELVLKKPKKIIVIEKDKFLSKNLENSFGDSIEIINDDILKIQEEKLSNEKMIFFGNLPYNISTKILTKWIKLKKLNDISKKFILMFQKEVADRIIETTNKKNYGRLTILTSWRMNVTKILDVSPNSFFPVPKVKSTVLLLEPKNDFFNIKDPKNLEHITNIFFNQRRKMIKKPINILFKNANDISKKYNINLNDRPQNLDPQIYFNLCREYEKLIS
tara:strand:+ start:342 stop:1133 length:792 start_codon:yes stop_codon:yes gene_type:complete